VTVKVQPISVRILFFILNQSILKLDTNRFKMLWSWSLLLLIRFISITKALSWEKFEFYKGKKAWWCAKMSPKGEHCWVWSRRLLGLTYIFKTFGGALHRGSWPSGPGREFPASASWVQALVCTSITPAVSYLSTGLAGCSVGPGISRGARKLA